ncbi:hypothetical protein AB0890_31845 [Streptomyces sp. NPDC005406]|uniref:AlbA family DNA-binding domain-containing protein n=1 Tax=Streptomyces sp. NPDC005406 TaxID=3155339 RepID=UPI003451D775
MTKNDEVRRALKESRLDVLLGLEESSWLDVKNGIYNLENPEHEQELLKDVASFANTSTGGLLVVGFKTEKAHDAEVVSELKPVPRKLVDLDRHRKLIDGNLIPTVRDLSVDWFDCGEEKGVLVIDIPAQPSTSQPFVVPGPAKGAPTEAIAVPMRRGDRTVWLPRAQIQTCLATGWAVTGAPAEPAASRTADRAKSGRVFEAIPPDAQWIKVLAEGAPLHRVPTWLSDAVYDAYDTLIGDVVNFIDSEAAEEHQALVKALGNLHSEFMGTFPPDGVGGYKYTEVPAEWKGTDPARYYEALEELSTARQRFVDMYRQLSNTLNRKGLLP